MTPHEAAKRLERAEAEFRAAQGQPVSSAAVVRYQAARRELEIAERIARALLSAG